MKRRRGQKPTGGVSITRWSRPGSRPPRRSESQGRRQVGPRLCVPTAQRVKTSRARVERRKVEDGEPKANEALAHCVMLRREANRQVVSTSTRCGQRTRSVNLRRVLGASESNRWLHQPQLARRAQRRSLGPPTSWIASSSAACWRTGRPAVTASWLLRPRVRHPPAGHPRARCVPDGTHRLGGRDSGRAGSPARGATPAIMAGPGYGPSRTV